MEPRELPTSITPARNRELGLVAPHYVGMIKPPSDRDGLGHIDAVLARGRQSTEETGMREPAFRAGIYRSRRGVLAAPTVIGDNVSSAAGSSQTTTKITN